MPKKELRMFDLMTKYKRPDCWVLPVMPDELLCQSPDTGEVEGTGEEDWVVN